MKVANARLWVVIPAAGIGSRFGDQTPKQHQPVAGKSVIEWALLPFLERTDITGIVIALADDDRIWPPDEAADTRVMLAKGGSERSESVLNSLQAIREQADPMDWVLVHDAARPCLDSGDLERLIRTLFDDPVGGLLATPVHDTLKRDAGNGRVDSTVERRGLWRAMTPQMFRYGLLTRALERAVSEQLGVTDESMAVELTGESPVLIQGRADNMKITSREDLLRAESVLAARTEK
ncbi:MAG: 2-C-methyl-D-erythritol 4-phosphate cytidylyltransferase [Gammaproteobacteria bacterium]